MSVELSLLAVNINFVAFSLSSCLGDLVGLCFALLVLHVVGGAEAAIVLLLVVYLPQSRLERGRGHQPYEG